ncbi:MAG: protoheme IX farnesyltransferase [Gemmatimonadetes bacterium]|nr:heme o synthase [Gemmatimonadota bacterium]NNM05891.1 protoheme IX farnesyltransferase [Gemmatimonadota bacterium]
MSRNPTLEAGETPGSRPLLERLSRLAVFYELTKPGIAGYVMVTAGVGYMVAARGQADFLPVIWTLVGTVLSTGGALALNQFVEWELDALMERTRSRPIPSGRLGPKEAFLFGNLLTLGGVGLLFTTVGWLPAALTALSALTYNLIYTPLKKVSYLSTLAGAFPGAMPTLIGWSAAAGTLTLEAGAVFAIAYLWQLPHVLSLGWMLRKDYARAGFYLIPKSDPEGRQIAWHITAFSATLALVGLAPTWLGITGNVYLVGMAALGVGLLGLAIATLKESRLTAVAARRVFLGSLVYHPLFLILLLVDAIRL